MRKKRKKNVKSFKATKKLVEAVLRADEDPIEKFMFNHFRSTKYIIIAETMVEDRSVMRFLTDHNVYRNQYDYLGMLAAAKDSIYGSLRNP